MKLRLQRLRAWWRVLFGFCPECNSDAPKIDTCSVCDSWRGDFPPEWSVRMFWLTNWESLRDGVRCIWIRSDT